MPTLGQVFSEARQRKKVTASQAAAATRMKVQHIEAMERDDFSRMAAPMYAKGFIRIYAEYLGLDSAPFIAEYMELHAPRERAPLMVEDSKPKPKRESVVMRFIRVIDWTSIRGMLVSGWRYMAAALAVLIVIFLAARITSRPRAPKVEEEVAQTAPVVAVPVVRHVLPVIKDPPEPYAGGLLSSSGTP
jgi:cytoskeletal protein RodZ